MEITLKHFYQLRKCFMFCMFYELSTNKHVCLFWGSNNHLQIFRPLMNKLFYRITSIKLGLLTVLAAPVKVRKH